jgi:hypothetical protein
MKESPLIKHKPFSLDTNEKQNSKHSINGPCGSYNNFKNKTNLSNIQSELGLGYLKNSKLLEEVSNANTCANTKIEQVSSSTIDFQLGSSGNKSNLFKSSNKDKVKIL